MYAAKLELGLENGRGVSELSVSNVRFDDCSSVMLGVSPDFSDSGENLAVFGVIFWSLDRCL